MRHIIILVLLTSSLFAQNSVDFFDPNELKSGMKGYALTVFQGTEPERMELEVIAYMPNRLAKAGMVLVRMSGANVERTGVAAGMSGSPVYIDGKLVGALAYTWANTKELMAGIVPIQDMISDKQHGKNTIFTLNNAIPIQTAWSIDGIDSSEMIQALNNISSEDQYPKSIEEFSDKPSSRSNGISPLKPGDAVAIKLIEGDINVASIGTVTYVDGEDVYIFGHPMDDEGPVSLPLAKAQIYDIIASRELSFKLGAGLSQTIGSTMFDGLSAVYGRFDKKAATMPLTINIQSKNYTNKYHMSIARSRKYLPTLIRTGVGAVMRRELGKNIEKQIKLSWNIQFTNNNVVQNEAVWAKETVFDPNAIRDYWLNYISVLWNNPLVHLVPENISMTIEILDKAYDYIAVHDVVSSRPAYLPGENVTLRVALRPYLGDIQYTNLTLPLPKNIVSGSYTIMVGSPLDLEAQIISSFPEQNTLRSRTRLLEELRKPIRSDVLKAALVVVKSGSDGGANFLSNLPRSRQSFFKNKSIDGQPLLSSRVFNTELEIGVPVSGISVVDIQIHESPPVKLN